MAIKKNEKHLMAGKLNGNSLLKVMLNNIQIWPCTPPIITSQATELSFCVDNRGRVIGTVDTGITTTGNILSYSVHNSNDVTEYIRTFFNIADPFSSGVKDFVYYWPSVTNMFIRVYSTNLGETPECYTDSAGITINKTRMPLPSDISVATTGNQTVGVGEVFSNIYAVVSSGVGTFYSGDWYQYVSGVWSPVTNIPTGSTVINTASLDTTVPITYQFQYRVKYKNGDCISDYVSSPDATLTVTSCDCTLRTNTISGKTQYYYGCDTNSFEALTISGNPPEADCSITGYQWYNSLDLGTTYTAIPGATSASCTPTSAIVYSAETPYRVDVTLHNSTFGCDETVSRYTSVKICQYIEIARATLRIYGTWITSNKDNQFTISNASLICSSNISTGTGSTTLNITSAGYDITGGISPNSKPLNSMTLQFTITNSSNSYGFVRVYSTLNCSSTNERFIIMDTKGMLSGEARTFTNSDFVTDFCPAKVGLPLNGVQDAAYITIEVSDQSF